MGMQQSNPSDVLQEGLNRAKNMIVAFAMVLFLLGKLLFQKIVMTRAKALGEAIVIRAATIAAKVWTMLSPHVEALKQKAIETRVKFIRVTLTGLITVLTPVENAAVKATGVAKIHSQKVATKTSMTFAQMMATTVTAIGTALNAGFSKPAIQKLLNKMFAMLDEAQK